MTVHPVLMSSDAALVAELAAAPASAHPAAIAVDWELPQHRATWADRRPAAPQLEVLTAVREASPWPVICRVNELGPGTSSEIDQAVDLGADEILLPMVRDPRAVERVLRMVGDRAGVGIMVETREAVAEPTAYAGLGLARAFVGLLDLAVERGTPTIFTALADGTVEAVVEGLDPVPYGFGGLTDPGRGHPLLARLLMGEIVRAGCAFSMMRNAFVADAALSSPIAVLAAVRRELALLERRDGVAVAADRVALLERIAELDLGAQEDTA